ncbi:DNA primase [Helicobacter baculiformis]|uniref:DNA primase n=1 Tax=Helicobacter baculiformis TaxID=427351 RepID=A0ABV7ZH95_9HELI|nr:DNA primase [Helicobacter baculiformis]
MITQESLDQLKQVADIVAVVQTYLELKKAGNLYVAICPFHDEKTPSFTLNPVRNSFKCFGCGKAGNAITFVMEYEKLDFVEATQKLANMFSVALEYTTAQPQPAQELDLLEEITRCYQNLLEHHKEAQDYLASRGVQAKSIQEFRLGFCLGPRVLEFIQRRRLDKQALLDLGVLGQDERGKIYARFSNRLIFPIHNPNGKIVGFGGRVLQENSQMAKYVNSPQSRLFNKSKLLYGYFQGRQHIAKSQQLILTEGYLDVILLHQVGFNNAVATLGTALTEQHLPLLERFDPDVVVSYDGDKAGRAAAFKGARMLATANRRGGVVLFKEGSDPAELIAQGKDEAMRTLLANPTRFVAYVIRTMCARANLHDPLSKQQILQEVLEFLHTLPPLLQKDYQGMVAHLLDISPAFVRLQAHKESHCFRHITPQHSMPRYIQEALLLKYLLNDVSLLARARPFLEITLFENLASELSALLAGKFDDPRLVKIRLDTSLPVRENGFRGELVEFLKMRYQEQQRQVETLYQNLSPEQRLEMLMDLRIKAIQLEQKKGDFYESLSLI